MEEWLGVRISTELMEALKELAANDGQRSVASVARQFLTEGVNRHYKQLPLVGVTETPDETIEQMKSHGCGPLPLVEA